MFHWRHGGWTVILLRLLGIGAVYGVGFMFIKSLFPEPFVLLILQGGRSSEGDLTTLALVYMGVGLLAGLIAGPIFGGALLLRRGRSERSEGSGPRFVLSLALALLTGFISGILTLIVYATGILPSGGVLDPLRLIEGANHPPGAPLLVAWTIARDLLPAGLAGLFLAPLAGGALQRLYVAERPPEQKRYSWEE
ncbi:MAG TPA: hypothetical protein VN178_15555 [Rubrobacter sp.]|jgi:hypothetical protein|nr:hypothetical protein [Rubrobacter sp.]